MYLLICTGRRFNLKSPASIVCNWKKEKLQFDPFPAPYKRVPMPLVFAA